jgi:hypothetical protein
MAPEVSEPFFASELTLLNANWIQQQQQQQLLDFHLYNYCRTFGMRYKSSEFYDNSLDPKYVYGWTTSVILSHESITTGVQIVKDFGDPLLWKSEYVIIKILHT